MRDLLNEIIITYLKEGKTIEVIRRYIQMKYRITIDQASIKQRIVDANLNYVG